MAEKYATLFMKQAGTPMSAIGFTIQSFADEVLTPALSEPPRIVSAVREAPPRMFPQIAPEPVDSQPESPEAKMRREFEFYINEEWQSIARAALDSGVDGVASLLKNRFDPDDERVRIRRVAEDDAILHDIQTAQAEIVGLREALGNLIHDCKTHATDINDIRWGYEGDGGTKLSAEQILEVCEAASKALASPPPPVITVDEAVRRIQGVPHGELISDFTIAEDKGGWDAGIEAVRARLIASTHDGASGGTKV